MRRAMDKVYHLSCFSCSLCRKELQTGEQLFLVQVRAGSTFPLSPVSHPLPLSLPSISSLFKTLKFITIDALSLSFSFRP